MPNSVESRIIGSIVGVAIGDAIGYPAEFRTRAQVVAEIGEGGIAEFIALKDPRFSRPFFTGPDHPPGTYTDDTQMTIAVAESVVSAGRSDLDSLMLEMSKRFVLWANSEHNNRAPGEACLEGCRNLSRGVHWRESGAANSKGCGSAMRVGPIGLYFKNLDQVADVARASSLLTHGHPAALESAAAAAIMVAMALDGSDPEGIYNEVKSRCFASSTDFASIWGKIPAFLDRPPEEVLVEGCLGDGWVGEEAVACAMYCFWRYYSDFQSAILAAVNIDGDSDSVGAITGAVLGAKLGVEAIPSNWRTEVEDSEYLHELGKRLYHARLK